MQLLLPHAALRTAKMRSAESVYLQCGVHEELKLTEAAQLNRDVQVALGLGQ